MTPRLGTIIPGSGRGFVARKWLEIEERGFIEEARGQGGGSAGLAPCLASGKPKTGLAASCFIK